jgi:uncharacterized protein DUF3303
MTLYLIIEYFPVDPKPIYERFRTHGRLAPEGLTYINSWVTKDLSKCYQIMETDDRKLLEEWMAKWEDLVRFEVVELLSSADAARKIMQESS